MNKREFLRMLENELSVLDPVECKEIIAFYEERFHTGVMYEGKNEEEIISELEHPRVIARNVLEEYGVKPRFVKTKEERYSNVSAWEVILLICADLFLVSWIVPTLFSIVVSVFGSSLTWITTISLMGPDRTVVDQYMFALLTGGYILLFMFGLVVLEMFIWTCKKVVIWHLNVFKIKKREKFIKRASSISVEKFFKNHRMLRFFKNIALIGSIVVVAISGFWIINHYDSIEDRYVGELETQIYTEDVSAEITNAEEWKIVVDVSDYDIDIKLNDTDEVLITHRYYELEDFTYEIDTETNEIRIIDDPDFEVHWGFTDIFRVLGGSEEIVISLPEDLVLGDIDLDTASGSINAKNINCDELLLESISGRVDAENITVAENATFVSTSGRVDLENIISLSDEGRLNATSVSGSVNLKNLDFDTYVISSTSGSVNLDNLNAIDKDGSSVSASSVSGSVDLDNVYVLDVDLSSVSGSVHFDNVDTSFICDSIRADSTSGSVDINVLHD